MPILPHIEQGPRKADRTLWRISPSSSSSSSSPPSSQSSSETPTSPPPSPRSPISYFDPFEQPKSPMLWTWTCHICNRSWRVGTTSRCLNCSHRMCMPEEPQSPSSKGRKANLIDSSPLQPLSSLLSAELSAENPNTRRPMLPLKHGADQYRHRYNQQLKRQFRRSRIRHDKRRKIKYCRSQFDYNGWQDWNEWRRDVKEFNKLRRGYENGESNDDDDTNEGTLDREEDEKDDEVETFKLVPATGVELLG
ncbi:hypothetical protein EYB25_003417 [Talaromyces marneffei]|nr:hypothetical protein EYB25_003417 [Talaromyces marneffei]